MSSNDVAVAVRGLSKSYSIAHNTAKPTTMGEALVHRAKNPFQQVEKETFWALKDIGFDIKKGDVVGIIGRNGAGKSTLLKVLSQITEPTKGEVRLYGRVGSLLEVGTGFHPELTGRENIYLNGAILGMRRNEIDREFDAIVDFAEVEQFLDTPVKRYSSGMYVRLAFAVAAHLNPEILIVDEVLAVGDAQFQKKCLGKMQDVSQEQGKTVIFVSHNMSAVQSLCKAGIVLNAGEVCARGQISEVISAYSQLQDKAAMVPIGSRSNRKGIGDVRVCNIRIDTGRLKDTTNIIMGQPVHFTLELNKIVKGLVCRISVLDEYGKVVAHFNSGITGPNDTVENPSSSNIVCELEEVLLAPGRYNLNVAIYTAHEIQDHVESAAFFDVEYGVVRGRHVSSEAGMGLFYLPHRWRISAIDMD